jgi:hypothetical protein
MAINRRAFIRSGGIAVDVRDTSTGRRQAPLFICAPALLGNTSLNLLTALMPSTTLAYPQVVSRTFT